METAQKSDPAANDLEQSPKRVRMERQEQEIVILSVCASTSGLIKSKEISPITRKDASY
jgi:hypothetical protein